MLWAGQGMCCAAGCDRHGTIRSFICCCGAAVLGPKAEKAKTVPRLPKECVWNEHVPCQWPVAHGGGNRLVAESLCTACGACSWRWCKPLALYRLCCACLFKGASLRRCKQPLNACRKCVSGRRACALYAVFNPLEPVFNTFSRAFERRRRAVCFVADLVNHLAHVAQAMHFAMHKDGCLVIPSLSISYHLALRF